MSTNFEWARQQRAPAEPGAQDGNAPAKCPTCKSASIMTSSKAPDRESYWRCTACGEVWNPSRVRTIPSYRGSR